MISMLRRSSGACARIRTPAAATLPNITKRQEGYAREVSARLTGVADVLFPKAARCREDIEEVLKIFAREEVDGIMIVNLTYGPGLRLVNAFRDVSSPLFLANIQPEPVVTKAWNMDDLTYNQGVHGAQDTANSLIHLGKEFSVWSGDWKDEEFVKAFGVFASAAHAVAVMKKIKVAVFGRMPGMGDILTVAIATQANAGSGDHDFAIGSLFGASIFTTTVVLSFVILYSSNQRIEGVINN